VVHVHDALVSSLVSEALFDWHVSILADRGVAFVTASG